MDEFVTSGRAVDLVLAFVVIEAIVLMAYRKVTGRGLRPLRVVLLLLPGVCLLLALRAALVGGAPLTVAAWLTAALFAHLADLWQRQHQA